MNQKDIETYYRRVEANFDWYASKYDAAIRTNTIEDYIRKVSSREILGQFRTGDLVLEVGCGTGQETMYLLRSGIRVHAIDISSKMIELLRERAEKEGVLDMLSTTRCRASDIGRLFTQQAIFDGVFSTFGAINSEPLIQQFLSGVRSVLKPGGIFIAGVWNRFCLIEMLLYGFTLRKHKLSGRISGMSHRGESRFPLDTMSYSVADFGRMLKGEFKILQVIGLPVVVPPPDFFTKMARLHIPIIPLVRVDFRVHGWPVLNRLGDFSLIVSKRA